MDKRVLELGSGTGLVGFVAHALGAQETIVTDLPQIVEMAVSNAEAYARTEHGARGGSMRVLPFDWGDTAHPLLDDAGLDVVLGAEVLGASATTVEPVGTDASGKDTGRAPSLSPPPPTPPLSLRQARLGGAPQASSRAGVRGRPFPLLLETLTALARRAKPAAILIAYTMRSIGRERPCASRPPLRRRRRRGRRRPPNREHR